MILFKDGKLPVIYQKGKKVINFRYVKNVKELINELNSKNWVDCDNDAVLIYVKEGVNAFNQKINFDRLVYESIYTIKAGQYLEVDIKRGKLREHPYWQGQFKLGHTNSAESRRVTDVCTDLLNVAIQRRFQSDVPDHGRPRDLLAGIRPLYF